MNFERCFCGCGKAADQLHHVVRQQELRRVAGGFKQTREQLISDQRNLVAVTDRCHGNHHARARPYHLGMLPDSVFEFAAETLGAHKAFNYLGRHYKGSDARLDALLDDEREVA